MGCEELLWFSLCDHSDPDLISRESEELKHVFFFLALWVFSIILKCGSAIVEIFAQQLN